MKLKFFNIIFLLSAIFMAGANWSWGGVNLSKDSQKLIVKQNDTNENFTIFTTTEDNHLSFLYDLLDAEEEEEGDDDPESSNLKCDEELSPVHHLTKLALLTSTQFNVDIYTQHLNNISAIGWHILIEVFQI
ncbi:MAG: hypothetical protein ACWA41_11470 [Putridiphycobacter sp.]